MAAERRAGRSSCGAVSWVPCAMRHAPWSSWWSTVAALTAQPRPAQCVLRRDQLSKLAAHVEIASRLNNQINENQLAELGKLEQVGGWVGRCVLDGRPAGQMTAEGNLPESSWLRQCHQPQALHVLCGSSMSALLPPPPSQDLVYGDATSKEVIAFLTANQAIPAADKASRAGVLVVPACPDCRWVPSTSGRGLLGVTACPAPRCACSLDCSTPPLLTDASLHCPPAGAPAHVLQRHAP